MNSLAVRYIIEDYTIETQRGLDIHYNPGIQEHNPSKPTAQRIQGQTISSQAGS